MQRFTRAGTGYRVAGLVAAVMVIGLQPRLAIAQQTGDIEPELGGIGTMSIAGRRAIAIHRQTPTRMRPNL